MVNDKKKNNYGRIVARSLIDIEAINLRPDRPYILTSGWASPVYIDCRKVIAHLEERRIIIDLAVKLIKQETDNSMDMIAGGETAGIPYAAWISEALSKPMLYVRKQPKGFGKMAQIEGNLDNGKKVLLVEDLATDGGSKVIFVDALRKAGGIVNELFVVFFYGSFPGSAQIFDDLGVTIHYLCDWWDVLEEAREGEDFSPKVLENVEMFLDDPIVWSKKNGGR